MEWNFQLFSIGPVQYRFKNTYFVIYGIISEFTDKGNVTSPLGQFQYLTLLRGLQGELTC